MEEKSGKGRILLVDDTPPTVSMVKTALESAGYEVFVATSGEKALRRAELTAPDLILLDILMPGTDGYETCRQLKAQEKTRDIPVIFMSALTGKFDKVKGFDAGGVDYVTKPIETEELLSRVNTHLTIRRLQADLIDAKTGLEEKVLARTEELRKSSLRLQEEISERKKAGQALRESQERYRALTEVTSDWVWEVNADCVYTYASPKIRDLLGFEPEEVIGKTPFDRMPPDEAERVRSEFRAIVESRKPFRILENENLHKDGHIVVLETSGVPVLDSNGGLLGYRGIDRDITERKRAEEALRKAHDELEQRVEERTAELRESNECLTKEVADREKAEKALQRQNELLKSVLEALTHPFYVINSDNHTIEIANSAAMASGITPASTCYSVSHNREEPCSGLEHPCPLEEIKKTKQPVTVEHIHYDTHGSRRNIEGHAYPLLDREGNVKQVIEYWWDITERKKAQEAQRLLATVVEQSAEMIIITDREGIVRYVNPAFENGSGYTAEEVVGNKTMFCYADEYDEERHSQLLDTLQSGGVWRDRLASKRKDGTPYHEEATIFPVRDASGKIASFVAIKRDISHQLELEEQLIVAQKMEAVGTLAGGIAHDFNNLIQIIVGYGELLSTQMEKTDPGYSDLEIVLKAGLRGAELVQSILTFSRQADSNPRPISLNNEVKQAHKLLVRTIPKMIAIELRLADDLKRIDADPAQIERVLVNLAVNSRDAMPDGGKLIIETENVFLDEDYLRRHLEVKPGHYVRLTVSDTGCGMERETVERIFDPFFTTKEIGRGTGLGLSTVFGIVKSHGGHILCYSEPGIGTTFKLDFPALEIEIETGVTESAEMPAFGTETILLVDDEAYIRELAKRYLTKAGYTILMAGDGAQALEVYRENQSDISLVILDLIMPTMGGKECLQELLKIDPKVKVLIASGFSPERATKETVGTLAKGFIDKPFRAKEMFRTIRRVLDEG